MSRELSLRMQQVGEQILANARNELYLHMRYLDLPLSALQILVTTQLSGVGTDGRVLFAHPGILADLFEANRLRVNRVYLHCVLHCLLRHLFKPSGEDARLWRLACDMAVESVADSMYVRCVRVGVSRLRRNWYERLKRELPALSAEGIYHALAGGELSERTVETLEAEFCIDDHSLWPVSSRDHPPTPMALALQEQWQDLAEKTQTRMETIAREAAAGGGSMLQTLQVENRERHDYRTFLKKFARLHEELHADPDQFDYVFYTYGLRMYGNLPLIEPQEQREVMRIREFVIVIDVSLSTRGDLVRQFLEETYGALSASETYLQQLHLRILQCDEAVVDDQKITCREELVSYMEHFTLKGGGGTDFRPAFAYVRDLQNQRELKNLQGMLYFTDGQGIFPLKPPGWETAFVFMETGAQLPKVPPWAIRLVLPGETWERKQGEMRTDLQFID